MRTATIFESRDHVEQYLKMADVVIGHPLEPAVQLGPIDTFLLRQLVDCYPVKLTVVDMAAEATLGISTVFWATQTGIKKTIAVEQECSASARSVVAWKNLIGNTMGEELLDTGRLVFLAGGTDTVLSGSDFQRYLPPESPALFMIAVDDQKNNDLVAKIDRLLNMYDSAIIALTPLGAVGDCRAVESALSICRSESAFKLALLREISPFCSSSQIGLVFRRVNRLIPDILNRIRRVYEGNFDFLSILEANVELQLKANLARERAESLEGELASARNDLVRLKRALASRTEELEAAYATKSGSPKNNHSTAPAGNDAYTQSPVGQVLSDFGAVAAWLRRGSS